MAERKAIFYALIWSVCTGAVWFGPAWFGFAMHIGDQDAALQYYPYFDFYAKALQQGVSFLWTPGMLSGFPVYLSQSGGFFDPINFLIFRFFDGISGVHVRIFLDIVATCFFSYLAARSFGVTRLASALVGPSFLIAYHARFLSNPLIANTLFLVPLLLYSANLLLEDRVSRLKVCTLIGVGIGIATLGGYTQMLVYALLAVGMYLLLHLFLTGAGLHKYAKILIGFSYGVALGFIIGLPYILPAAKFLPLSARDEAPTYEQATKKVVEVGDVVLFAVPDHFYIPYVTSGRKPLYVGALWSLLAFASIAYASLLIWRRRYNHAHNDVALIAVSILAVLFLVLSVKYSPLFYLQSKLPILGQFRFPYRFMYVGVFFFALLGAIGYDRIQDFVGEKFVRRVVTAVTFLYAALALFIVCVNVLSESTSNALAGMLHTAASVFGIYSLLGMSKGSDHYADAFARGLNAAQELLSFNDNFVLVPTVVLIMAIITMVLYIRGIISIHLFRNTALIVSAFTVLMIPILRYQYYVPQQDAGTAAHIAMSQASTDDVARYRMYSFLVSAAIAESIPPQYRPSNAELNAVLEISVLAGVPDYHLYQPLASVDGYDQFEMSDTLAAIERVGGVLYAGYGSGTDEERTQRLLENLDVLAMMGGKYVISGVELANPRLQLLSDEKYTEYLMRLRLYEVKNVRPIYYIPEKVVPEAHADFRDLMQDPKIDFDAATYLDCANCSATSGDGDIQLRSSTNGYYEFETTSSGVNYLVLSESLMPGWEARVDGQSVDIMRANGLYMAITLPSGNHTVQFEFQGVIGELQILKMLRIVDDTYGNP